MTPTDEQLREVDAQIEKAKTWAVRRRVAYGLTSTTEKEAVRHIENLLDAIAERDATIKALRNATQIGDFHFGMSALGSDAGPYWGADGKTPGQELSEASRKKWKATP